MSEKYGLRYEVMKEIEIPEDEIGRSGYSKLAWKIWNAVKLPMTQCETIDRIVREEGYRKQSEWISVEDRLPDSDGKYLVYTGKGLIHTMYYYATNAFGFEHWDVTHWMPLPEAPKGGAE